MPDSPSPRGAGREAPLPRIYCLTPSPRTERRRRMERRLGHHGLLERTRFVDTVTIDLANDGSERWKELASAACFASHLKAMRLVLSDPEGAERGGIVCEDDVLLHDEFPQRARAVLDNLPGDAPLCALGYFLRHWDAGFRWAGRDPGRHNVCPLVARVHFGAHMYWISPRHARSVLARYGAHDVHELPNVVERITHDSGGYVAWPSLALQDVIDSTIRPADELGPHVEGQAEWDYTDYDDGEDGEHRSPLARVSPPARPSVRLVMIVRDEAAVIERCLASARPLIDSWTICDTGSADGTPERIEALLADLPGELHHRPWRDFGANRTELLELAAPGADYLLLADADMTVEGRGPLPRLRADAYLARYDGSLSYAVPRIVRASRRWWYEGSTHEYLATEGEFSQEMLETLVVHHHGDGGRRHEKFERDRRLLERDLEADPDDQRATFYLAQTLRDLGDDEGAIELYRRRVELGGWDEEVFYAAFQAGVLTGRRDPAAALALLVDAFERRPSRAEPLHELARICRSQGWHRSAHLFARRGLDIPVPGDVLFVHRDVYEWGMLFEYSIAAYWAGDPRAALEANDRLLTSGALPADVEQSVRENRRYCLDALPHGDHQEPLAGRVELLEALAPSLEVAEVRLEVDPPWPQFNPSIAADGEGFAMIVRTASYRLLDDGRYAFLEPDGLIRTLNYLVALDRDLGIASVRAMRDEAEGLPAVEASVQGYEDCRLFRAHGRWMALATVRDRDPSERCRVALLHLEGDRFTRLHLLEGPTPDRHEKNWMPFVRGDEVRIVYTCGPTVIFACDTATGALRTVAHHDDAPAEAGAFRGGSQGLALDDGFLFVVHEAFDLGGRRRYVHRFVRLDAEGRVQAYSRRWTLTSQPVEICAGLARRGDELLLSFGAGDAVAGLALVSEAEALALLEPPGRDA